MLISFFQDGDTRNMSVNRLFFNDNNVYFSVFREHAQGKIKFVSGWCRGNAKKRNQEDKGMSATLEFSGTILKGRVRSSKGVRKAQVWHLESKTRKLVSQVCAVFPGTVRERHTASSFVFKCTECAYLWLKISPKNFCACCDMAKVAKRKNGNVQLRSEELMGIQ